VSILCHLATHDQEEALAISDRVIVMNTGMIEQIGTPGEIYDIPQNAFVADFVGTANLLRGTLRRDPAQAGLVALKTASGAIVHGCENGRPVRSPGAFSVRTVYPWLTRSRPTESLNVWEVRIDRRVFLGDFVQYLVAWGGEQLVVRRPPTERFDEGETVYMGIAPEHCVLLES
jgi:iron(III) transport system ATP-binding protein